MGLFSRNLVFFPGCAMQAKMKEHVKNWRAILDDLDINYIEIPELQCCGAPAREAGYHADFNGILSQNRKLLKDYRVREIISPCASCVHTFNELYGIDTRHTTEVLAERKNRIGKRASEEAAYHDSCILARKAGIIDQPREVLERTGVFVKEFAKNKSETVCCGGCGLFPENSPELAASLAKRKLAESPSKTIIVADPHCYLHLHGSAGEHRIVELSELFVR